MTSGKEPKSPELAAFIHRMLEMQGVLNEDSAEALDMFRFGTHDFCARTMVRTLSAEFEAQIYFLEQFLIGLNEASPEIFKISSDELQVLKAQTLAIKPSGELSASPRFHPFRERLLFTLRIASRVINPAAKPDTYCLNWASVKEFVEIRNRLTHPKRVKDLHVSDEEIDHLNRAQDWIRGSMRALFNAGGFADEIKSMAQRPNET
jgi:hypothetical protein